MTLLYRVCVSPRRYYHGGNHGALFAYVGRARPDATVDWVDETSNPLPLTVALLYKSHLAASAGRPLPGSPPGSTGLNPAYLLKQLGHLWAGDPRDLPHCVSYTKAFPYLFNLEYGLQGVPRTAGGLEAPTIKPSTVGLKTGKVQGQQLQQQQQQQQHKHLQHLQTPPRKPQVQQQQQQPYRNPRALLAVKLSPEALALVNSGKSGLSESTPPPPKSQSHYAQGGWGPEATALLSSTPLHWLPKLTSKPCPDTWGPLIHGILEREGTGPHHRVHLEALLFAIGKEALQKGLPLPPNQCAWFALSPHPAFARLRVLWEEQLNGGKRVGKNRGPVALELMPEGMTSLQESLGMLAALANEARERKKEGGAGGQGAK